jgi:hypothetical protein
MNRSDELHPRYKRDVWPAAVNFGVTLSPSEAIRE